jgi:2-phospho-L-lactate guanylyltransferase
VRGIRPEAPLAALNADLPALRARELAHVLQAAAEAPRAFLADADGTGTTLLSAMPGHALRPRFGPRSRARHAASGAAELLLSDAVSVRQDVDTEADLAAAVVLGVGPHTAGALCGGPGPTPVNAV